MNFTKDDFKDEKHEAAYKEIVEMQKFKENETGMISISKEDANKEEFNDRIKFVAFIGTLNDQVKEVLKRASEINVINHPNAISKARKQKNVEDRERLDESGAIWDDKKLTDEANMILNLLVKFVDPMNRDKNNIFWNLKKLEQDDVELILKAINKYYKEE